MVITVSSTRFTNISVLANLYFCCISNKLSFWDEFQEGIVACIWWTCAWQHAVLGCVFSCVLTWVLTGCKYLDATAAVVA